MFQIKIKNLLILLGFISALFISVGFFSVSVYAQSSESQSSTEKATAIPADCNNVEIKSDNCGIIEYLVIFINVLSVLAGIIITISIAYGGIQYSMAGADPQKVSAAKERIRNAIIALVFFIFGYAILNYLIPGGLL